MILISCGTGVLVYSQVTSANHSMLFQIYNITSCLWLTENGVKCQSKFLLFNRRQKWKLLYLTQAVTCKEQLIFKLESLQGCHWPHAKISKFCVPEEVIFIPRSKSYFASWKPMGLLKIRKRQHFMAQE